MLPVRGAHAFVFCLIPLKLFSFNCIIPLWSYSNEICTLNVDHHRVCLFFGALKFLR